MRRLALLLPLIAVATLSRRRSRAAAAGLRPGRRRRLAEDSQAADHGQRAPHDGASRRRAERRVDDAEPRAWARGRRCSRSIAARQATTRSGSELFDALGLIRTDELARAGQYYGLDEQYFTQVADYGFSKRLDEALTEWDREQLLRDMVRAIRRFRPLVVVSRWQGSAAGRTWPASGGRRDHAAGGCGGRRSGAVPGTGRRTAAPLACPQAVSGRRARERGVARARGNRARTIPVLGDSYNNVGRAGLSLQRSQTSGRLNPTPGPAADVLHARRWRTRRRRKETSLFDGLDTSLAGAYRLLGLTAPAGAVDRLAAVAREARAARDAFSWTDPSASAPALARGLGRRAPRARGHRRCRHRAPARREGAQFVDALVAALGLQVVGHGTARRPFGPHGAVCGVCRRRRRWMPSRPGQTVDVRVAVAARGRRPVRRLVGDGVGSVRACA